MFDEQRAHLPDLDFVRACWKEYGVNRGIYNVIDKWLYENGCIDIAKRRNTILRFLYFCQVENKMNKGSFGKGGVCPALIEFMQRENREYPPVS